MVAKVLLILFATVGQVNQNSNCIKTEDKNVAIAKKVYEFFNKHDWVSMAELYSDPADFKDPSLGKGIVKQTRNQTIEKYKKLQKFSSDIKDDIVQIYPSGDKYVIVEFVSSGTTSKGEKWTLPIVTIFKVENGKITSDYTYYDQS